MEAYRKSPFMAKFVAFYLVLIVLALIVVKNPFMVAFTVGIGLGLAVLVSRILK